MIVDTIEKALLPLLDSKRKRVPIDAEKAANGLGQLVLTLIKLVHELLEKQAVRRLESGSLTDEQIEKLGDTLMKQAEEIRTLCDAFGITESDLKLDLGPLGRI